MEENPASNKVATLTQLECKYGWEIFGLSINILGVYL